MQSRHFFCNLSVRALTFLSGQNRHALDAKRHSLKCMPMEHEDNGLMLTRCVASLIVRPRDESAGGYVGEQGTGIDGGVSRARRLTK